MAQYKRPPKVKEKTPDEFISFWDHVVRFFMSHRYKFIGLVVIALFVFGAYGLWIYLQGKQAKETASLYEAALQEQGEQAVQEWQSLIQQNPPLSIKSLAALELGGRFASEKNWSEAAKAFQEASQSKENTLQVIGFWAAASSWENEGNFQQALTAYEQMAQDEDSPYYFEGLLGKARVLIQENQVEAAKKILRSLIQEGTQAPALIQKEAKQQLLALQVQ